MNPRPLTIRQLWWMDEAKVDELWRHTASIKAMIANVNRGKNQRPFNDEDFNNAIQAKRSRRRDWRPDIGKKNWKDLKHIFFPHGSGKRRKQE